MVMQVATLLKQEKDEAAVTGMLASLSLNNNDMLCIKQVQNH